MAKLTLNDIVSGYGTATLYNANNTLIEAALENTLSRDGTTPNTMSASLDMNSQLIHNLGTPVVASDAARKADVDAVVAAGLPTQTSHANQVLGTDGTTASWLTPTAANITNVPAGTVAAVTVQAAIDELNSDAEAHLADTIAAHAASAIANTPAGNVVSTTVQAAINELDTDLTTESSARALIRTDLADTADLAKGDALIGVKHPGTGSVATTLHAYLARKVYVKDFGATGDGVTDDTAAIHLARDAAGVGGQVIFTAPGTYLVAGLDATVASQTWIIEEGAELKQKAASVLNVINVSANYFSLYGTIDGNRANAAGGGLINVTAGVLLPRFDVSVRESPSYGIYAPDVGSLYVRGKFTASSKPAIFNTMVTGAATLSGPDIDVYVDFGGESTNDASLQAILIRGAWGGNRYDGGRVRARVFMPINPTPSAELCCEIRSCRNIDVDLHTYGGSMPLSLIEVNNVGGHVNGKAFNHYGVEYGGLCVDCHIEGIVDGTNNAGTNLALYPLAFQGTDGQNSRCSFTGTVRGSAGATAAATIFYDNGEDCHISGDIYCGAALYLLKATNSATFGKSVSLAGRFHGETGGDYIVFTSEHIGKIDVRGYARDFDLAGMYISASSAITIDNINMSVNFDNCNGGGFVTALSGGAALGEYVTAKGCTGQYVGGGTARADIINLKRAIYYWEIAGTPEGVLTAGIGSEAVRNDGSNGGEKYIKVSGTGNTGWQVVQTAKSPGAASAWILFNGTGTPAVTASYGCSSPTITDGGVGLYTINWGVTFDTASYVTVGSTNGGIVDFAGAKTTTTTGVRTYNDTGAGVDNTAVMVLLFGGYTA